MSQNFMSTKYRTFSIILLSSAVAYAGEAWSINSQEDWENNLGSQSNVVLKEGLVSPTAKNATIQSKLKSFSEKRSVKSITFEQSSKWLNWNNVGNIGTSNMQDAPVLLSLGPDDYWMFAKYGVKGGGPKSKKKKGSKDKKLSNSKEAQKMPKAQDQATLEGFDIPLMTTEIENQYKAPGGMEQTRGGYHAWQSRDMKNWVHHGPVTESKSRWMTTAEYVDGKFHFYYDFPNDQDPHVFVDSNLFDGKPGEDMGMAFKDPSHGSDCVFIRDLDGNFHVIYENWDPINASTHAWDSPLAGHAVSKDGLKDFKILAPAVDERTKPTGEIGTFNHPHWKSSDPENYPTSVAEYEIHEPAQDAYGDWASISVGGQYYLFGDFDPAGSKEMSVAWFTSSSLDEQFEFCGNIGKGHPDPDVCFAEGQFYLATQQQDDFVSPGPWVESVEVRVGVDTDNDKKVDKWSDWQMVKETYDHIPGFAKQVAKTAAMLDLSSLPEGYGFQFEVKLTDTTENISTPELDKVTIDFN